MRVVVLTSSRSGMSALGLEALLADRRLEVAALVLSGGGVASRWRFYRRKLRKFLWQVGPTGLVAGRKIRRIFDTGALAAGLDTVAIARGAGVEVRLVDLINCSDTEQMLRSLAPEAGVSLDNGLIRPGVYSIPPRGTINVHHGLVPRYRGGPPVFWEIHNRERSTGFTIHKLDRHTDTGEVLYEETVPVEYRPTLGETMRVTMAELMRRSARRLAEVLADLDAYERVARRQDGAGYNTTPSLLSYWRAERSCRQMYAGAQATAHPGD
jgi:methionyl-tRNA formyltransferase